MTRYGLVGLSIVALAGIIIGAAWWIRVFYGSIENYRSPLHAVELPVQPSAPQRTPKVVIVLISGLGYDDSFRVDMPVFEQLRQAGANAAILSTPPTYAYTAWATLVTGAPPEINDAPPFDVPLEHLQPIAIDTMFARATADNVPTSVYGMASWGALMPSYHLGTTLFVDAPGPSTDQRVVEAALPALEVAETGLVLIHLTQLDYAARNLGGTESDAYRQAALNVDRHLSQISTAMNLGRSVLMVLSEHGYTEDGGHGGDEVAVIWQPLVMVGEGVVPGSYSDIYQTDIAPTVTALLGLSPPTASHGRILFEMLQFSRREQALAQFSLAQQRVALAEAYLTVTNNQDIVLPDRLLDDMTQAQLSFEKNNVNGAFELARLTQEQADSHMKLVRADAIQWAQFPRLAIAGMGALLWLLIMWRQRGIHMIPVILAVIVTVGLYHSLYQLQGFTYSLSSLTDITALPSSIARRTGVSLMAGGSLLLVYLMLVNEDDWLTLLCVGYGFSMLTTFIFALPLFFAFWQNGFYPVWYLPEVWPTFLQITSLFEIMVAATLGMLLPWPIMTLNFFIGMLRRYLSDEAQPADILPGLRPRT